MRQALPFHLITLDNSSKTTLQQQIQQQLVKAIMKGSIPEDVPLPSSRKLSSLLHVSRNTVILAYDNLLDDGYIISKERSGYYVNPGILDWKIEEIEFKNSDPSYEVNWQSLLSQRPSSFRNIVKPTNWQRYEYPFIYGQFDPDNFPTMHWRECVRDSVVNSAISIWASDILTDDPLLINLIQTQILPRRGIWAKPEEILISYGAQQALYLVVQLLMSTETILGVENPGYVDLRNIALTSGVRVKSIPLDERGMIIDGRLNNCDYVFTTPSHQFPTTVTMPLDRRKKLIGMANDKNFIIIEDDYESEANFKSNPTPALKSIDSNGRVIYIGSFSKTLAPGIRVGFLVAPQELIDEARLLRRLMVRNVSQNNQRALALFIERGHYNTLVHKRIINYQERWKEIGEALHEYLPESFQPPTFGGTSYWIKGPANLNANELAKLALQKSVIMEPGEIYFKGKNCPKNYFKLGYSSIPTEKVRKGIKILSDLIHNDM